MNLDAIKKDKMKQRSFYMDDETYALIEAHATRLGTSNGTALRMLVRGALLDAPAEPVSQRPLAFPPEGTVLAQTESVRAEQGPTGRYSSAGIVLPPDSQENFTVPTRFKEKGPRPARAQHVDDDF